MHYKDVFAVTQSLVSEIIQRVDNVIWEKDVMKKIKPFII